MLHEDYENNLEAGRRFEDCCVDHLDDNGVTVVVWTSAKYQRDRGESKYGYEFKLDRLWRYTGNLAIETAERPNKNSDFKPSGPFHKHQPEWIVIGDCCLFWQIGSYKLRSAIESGNFPSVENKTRTAKITLIPTEVADELATAIHAPNPKEF
jgi:hypothetical protein